MSLKADFRVRTIHEMMDRQYAQVLDEPVPSLGDKTPRQLATTRAGKAKLAVWLKHLENVTSKADSEQMVSYSFAWMWEELGVSDLRR